MDEKIFHMDERNVPREGKLVQRGPWGRWVDEIRKKKLNEIDELIKTETNE